MAGKCSHEGCHDPDNDGCNIEGCSILTDCKYYGKGESKTENFEQDDSVVFRIPWTGNSFGLSNLNYLTASSKPILIGITGVANAGKTAFLASLYCLLRHGHKIGEYSFTNSLTLTGWEDIAWFLSWKPNGDIQFPPHTTSNAGRVPGLLHLALKNEKGEKKDLIFTDAPGEWFDYWRNNVNSDNAQGAKWIHENCNAFLLFADNDELSGGNRGTAKQQITSVADRLFENIEDRPIGLIWSKSDISIKDLTKQQILSHLNRNQIVHFSEFETSVQEGESGIFHKNILDSINWIIDKLQSNINTKPAFISLKQEDMFFSKRTING
jgi:hypothetical protein